MTYVDTPHKKQKHPHYEHRTTKLDNKNNQFTRQKFHKVRKVSTTQKVLDSFGRIGMCLNNKSSALIPTENLDKVCFILINSYTNQNDNNLGVGPLNDGYLVGLKHHRLGFKIFYLFNPRSDEFTSYLSFFTKNVFDALTVFYTGRDSISKGVRGIEFSNGSLSSSSISEIISQCENDKAHITFITDCCNGGSVFDINEYKDNEKLNLMSLYVDKESPPESKESKLSHGIFTYYLFKILSDDPSISPCRIEEKINSCLKRFDEKIKFDVTKSHLKEKPVFC